ncbi:Putative Leucine Rich Repeat Receptor [Ectocarpus siliculosus]|uniref:Leucine Rich Repeat Receptor n=1 Tax=Ectocarpus siliculosus TaxID=2880 RepID=D7FML3_ECTSI|nr:Putative Leucine Rich Repeat Receptor [Ectocarpus siliculosus]|eukprot:CBJ25910.1 Putative Leucine Rich Repeat Receptor [Ectocarpus siliculosus]
MHGMNDEEQLEQSHQDCLVRAHAVLVECQEFMRSFEDGKWMVKALKKDKHAETFQVLHESLTYIFQNLHLEIDYHSLKKQSAQAEMRDVAHVEDQLASVAANMEVLVFLRMPEKTISWKATVKLPRGLGHPPHTRMVPKGSMDKKRRTKDATGAIHPQARLTPGRPPKPGVNATAVQSVASKAVNGRALGPSLHIKPYSQSYGVGLAAGVMAGGWLADAGLASGASAGDGGAKRGEYEVSFGEGPMGMSLKNVDARAEVSKTEQGGAAAAAGVRPGDNVSGINGRIPLGYTQVMGTLPTTPRPVRICFTRGQGSTISPGGPGKKSHASTWASNAVTAGVHHPAGDKGVLLEIYAQASLSSTTWVRSQGWDELPPPETEDCAQAEGTTKENRSGSDIGLERWSGVRIGRKNKVVEIRLPGNGMVGVLPASTGSLDELRILELRENRLEGNIPESLRYLQKLTKVDLAHNLLEGSVPGGDARWIGSMSVLLLQYNKLSGHIPSTLGRLVNLTQLDLSFNQLSGNIPSELSNARALEVLSLCNNVLIGPVPESFGGLTNLKVLNASNNKLAGPLPQGLGRLTRLEVLSLQHNLLNGSIPDDTLSSDSLVFVDVSFNALEGKIPNSVGACSTNLTYLDMSRNSLSGELPSNIGGACKLKKLNLEKNSIGGALPTSLAECKALEDLNISNNQLMGPLVHIPWANLENLEHLLLGNNKLEGTLPASFGSLKALVSLDCSKNQLAGNIPREYHNLQSLKLLDLSGNKIAAGLLQRGSSFRDKRTLKKKLSECDVRF